MTWIDIVWPMMGGASLTLAVTHLLVGLRRPVQPAHLMFALAAASMALLSVIELRMMRTADPVEFGTLLRWAHVPVAGLAVAVVVFVRLHFGAGRLWLAALACAMRVGILVPNFTTGVNINFASIDTLAFVPLWAAGEVAIPIGTANPWMLVAQFANVALVAFMLDALFEVRRRGDPELSRRAGIICGSIALFVVLAATWAAVMVLAPFNGPWTINVAFFVVVLAMSYDLGGEVVRAALLAQRLAHSQASLQESEQRLNLAARAAGLGIWTWDIGRGSYWSTDIGHSLLGLAAGDRLTREQLLALIHPDDRPGVLAAREEAVQGSGEFACEFRLAAPGDRWLAAIGGAEPAAPGKPGVIRGVLLDVTERRQEVDRFRRVIERAPTAMLIVGEAGTIAYANTRAATLFGLDQSLLSGRQVQTLMPDWTRASQAALAVVDPALPAPTTAPSLEGLRADGSSLALEIGLAPVRIGADDLVVAALTDVGERRRMEQETALQRDELAHLSRVALLGELSGSIAHELNQPLTAVLSNAQAALRFLQHEPPNLGEVRDSLVDIVENDKRASDVIRRLRTMLRKEQPDYQPLDANEVVLDMLRLIDSDLLNRSVTVVRELAPDLPGIQGDRVQLQQVLLNLIVNACDAMDARGDGRQLTIRTGRTPGGGVEIAISDLGTGIPATHLEWIFDPFVTTKKEGIGLGLPICRTILRAHGGTLAASNNPTAGATLRMQLPPHPADPAVTG